jgi:hypothetical protein
MTPAKNQKAFVEQEKAIKSGEVVAGPLATQEAPKGRGTFMSSTSEIYDRQMPRFKSALFGGIQSGIQAVKDRLPKAPSFPAIGTRLASPSPSPVPTRMPTPTPMIQNDSIGPIVPQDIPKTWYTNRTSKIEPKLWDAITTATPSSDPNMNDYMKRLALALATQESSGGYKLSGDNGKSNGPYHIQRANVTKEQAMDPVWATNYLYKEMNRNLKSGMSKEQIINSWNSLSGIVNKGPRYNVDLPQMATTSTFLKNK